MSATFQWWISVLSAVCAIGCSSPRGGDRPLDTCSDCYGAAGYGGDGAAGYGAAGYGGGGAAGIGESESPTLPAFESFEIPIEQVVTVGAFSMTLGRALVSPVLERPESANVEVDFDAQNNDSGLTTPLGAYAYGDDLLLEVDTHFFYGSLFADAVPGLRRGQGVIRWVVDRDEVDVEAIAQAVITIGRADENQVVVPLADPTATVGFNDISLPDTFTLTGLHDLTFEVTSIRVQFGSRGNNMSYPAGTAAIVFSGTLIGDEDASYGYTVLSADHVFLERPDGSSVPPPRLSEIVHARERKPADIVIAIEAPYAGTYVFGFYDRSGATVSHEFRIP